MKGLMKWRDLCLKGFMSEGIQDWKGSCSKEFSEEIQVWRDSSVKRFKKTEGILFEGIEVIQKFKAGVSSDSSPKVIKSKGMIS